MRNYRFVTLQSIYDQDCIFYALEHDGVEKLIDNVRFIEVTSDFSRVQFIRADSLKSIGFVDKRF